MCERTTSSTKPCAIFVTVLFASYNARKRELVPGAESERALQLNAVGPFLAEESLANMLTLKLGLTTRVARPHECMSAQQIAKLTARRIYLHNMAPSSLFFSPTTAGATIHHHARNNLHILSPPPTLLPPDPLSPPHLFHIPHSKIPIPSLPLPHIAHPRSQDRSHHILLPDLLRPLPLSRGMVLRTGTTP